MTFYSAAAWASVPAHITVWGPVVLAFSGAGVGGRLVRRATGSTAVGAVAVAVAWAALDLSNRRWWLHPRHPAPSPAFERAFTEWLPIEWLILPAAALAIAGAAQARIRSRWWTLAAVCFGAWWLAGAAASRAEFWRVEFGAVAVAWALVRAGAGAPERGLAMALSLFGAVILGHAGEVWSAATLVLAAACLGLLAAKPSPARSLAPGLLPGLLMVGVVGTELAGGRAQHGALGAVDLACLGAIAAPAAVPWVETLLRRRIGRAAQVAASASVAAAVIAMAGLAGLRLQGGR